MSRARRNATCVHVEKRFLVLCYLVSNTSLDSAVLRPPGRVDMEHSTDQPSTVPSNNPVPRLRCPRLPTHATEALGVPWWGARELVVVSTTCLRAATSKKIKDQGPYLCFMPYNASAGARQALVLY